jgi:hypothetical protein
MPARHCLAEKVTIRPSLYPHPPGVALPSGPCGKPRIFVGSMRSQHPKMPRGPRQSLTVVDTPQAPLLRRVYAEGWGVWFPQPSAVLEFLMALFMAW